MAVGRTEFMAPPSSHGADCLVMRDRRIVILPQREARNETVIATNDAAPLGSVLAQNKRPENPHRITTLRLGTTRISARMGRGRSLSVARSRSAV